MLCLLPFGKEFEVNFHDFIDGPIPNDAILGNHYSYKWVALSCGMESESELAFLRFNRCGEVQGYFLSKPLTAKAATKLLQDNPKLDVTKENSYV